MKKLLLSIAVSTALFSSNAMASDLTAISKAVVKLIKNQKDLEDDQNKLANNIAESNKKIEQLTAVSKVTSDEAKKSYDTSASFKTKIDAYENQINSLTLQVKELKSRIETSEKFAFQYQQKLELLEKVVNEKIDSVKNINDAELKIMKSKIEATPKEVEAPKPKKYNDSYDATINSFIKGK